MARFSDIIKNLRQLRLEALEKSIKRKRKGGVRSPKKEKPIVFDSPELNAIFSSMPKDLQSILTKAQKHGK